MLFFAELRRRFDGHRLFGFINRCRLHPLLVAQAHQCTSNLGGRNKSVYKPLPIHLKQSRQNTSNWIQNVTKASEIMMTKSELLNDNNNKTIFLQGNSIGCKYSCYQEKPCKIIVFISEVSSQKNWVRALQHLTNVGEKSFFGSKYFSMQDSKYGLDVSLHFPRSTNLPVYRESNLYQARRKRWQILGFYGTVPSHGTYISWITRNWTSYRHIWTSFCHILIAMYA